MDTKKNSTHVDLNALKINIKSKKHWEHPKVINIVTVKVTHPELGNIVTLHAWKISRGYCADDFLDIMDQDMDEMQKFLAVALFDKLGNVRPHLIEPGFRSGTGCWGSEMNKGVLVYIIGGICSRATFQETSDRVIDASAPRPFQSVHIRCGFKE